MNELRWILIGFGIVLLAGIYLWGRRGQRTVASDDVMVRARPEPALHGRLPMDSGDTSLDSSQAGHASLDHSMSTDEPLITAIRPTGHTPDSSIAGSEPAGQRGKPSFQDTWRGRVEPTFAADSAPTEELPIRPDAPTAPTLSSSESPQPRRSERRKILSLRLAASPQRLDGAKLLEVLQAESLQHGKYDVFHRLHEDGVSIFSIASMVEPGAFDVAKMPETQYPGITLFAQLPGPVPGMHALNELIACARKLQQSIGGTLQDDRGVPLTVHRIERLRQEVREFERPPGAVNARGASPSLSS
ncbi:MAG: cell division protein ZipA C-terminal FtsZ-binding domain-containing protein [Steroidobacter sp.]